MKLVESMEAARAMAEGVVGLVPTMGYFHEGHLSLIEQAVQECDQTVVTLFVNPLQFDENSDFERYPTDLDRDFGLAEDLGADVMVVPSVDEMYPIEPLSRVTVSMVGEHFEGEHRPGHLTGVATVVAKLFAGLQPSRAYFGRKDAQQLAMIRRLVVDLSFPVQVVGCRLVREHDGLALSSRNVFLGHERGNALGISRGLLAAADSVEAGERDGTAIEDLVAATSPHVDFEYVGVATADAMQPTTIVDGPVALLAAAHIGGVRLIDNVSFAPNGNAMVADRGRWLDGPSMMFEQRGESNVPSD